MNRSWTRSMENALLEIAQAHPEWPRVRMAAELSAVVGRRFTEDQVRNKLKRMAATTATLPDPEHDWGNQVREFGLDPDAYEIITPVSVRSWETEAGRKHSYAARIRPKAQQDPDLGLAIEEIKRFVPAPAERVDKGDLALVVGLSDWQIGKRGTKNTTDRVLALVGQVLRRTEDLRSLGKKVDTLYLLGMGDMVEGCSGHYAMQTFEVELNQREQVRLARRLIVSLIQNLGPHFREVVVACVPGNHGENRVGGKAFTSFGDSMDIEVFEQASEVIGASSALSNVEFLIPEEELSIVLNVKGTRMAVAHGHQVHSGAAGKVKAWWSKQAFGMQPSMEATILMTGHFHHLVVDQDGPRTHFQCPTLDDGSPWFEATNGVASIAGTLTFVVGPEGWDDMAVLS